MLNQNDSVFAETFWYSVLWGSFSTNDDIMYEIISSFVL